MSSWSRYFAVALLGLTTTTFVRAQTGTAFQPGNLVVLRVGDGTTAPTALAAQAALLEYTPAGTLVQTIALDNTVDGANRFALRGSSTTEGILSLSPNGQFLTFGGYRANNGGGNPSGAGTDGQVARVIGLATINSGANTTTINTTQAVGTGGDQSFWNDSFRSVATDNGQQFWLSGASSVAANGSLRYVPNTTATASTSLTAAGGNTRQVQVINGNLFISAGSATPGRSVYQVGTGLPTSGTPTFTNAFPIQTTPQYNSFFFADLSGSFDWNGTGFDTLYATDTNTSNLAKFSFDGTAWTQNNIIAKAGIVNIAGSVNGTSVTLYASSGTISTGDLSVLTDTAGNGANNNGTFAALTTPVAAGTNFAFRGLVLIPVPEPTTMLGGCALAAGAFGWLRRRRQ